MTDFEKKIMEYFNKGYYLKCECKKDVIRVLYVLWKNKICWREGSLISAENIKHGNNLIKLSGRILYAHKKVGNFSYHDKEVKGKKSVLCFSTEEQGSVITVFEIDKCLLNRT